MDTISTVCPVKTIRIGSYKFEPKEKVVFSSIGLRIIAPNTKRSYENVILDIQQNEIARILCHLNKPLCILFIWTKKQCGSYVRESLEMNFSSNDSSVYYDPCSLDDHIRLIILQMDNMSEEAKSTLKSIFISEIIKEISYSEAKNWLEKSTRSNQVVSSESNTSR